MPAFCWDSNTAPSENDRPVRNGCDYSFYDNWDKPRVPFIVESAGIEQSMGIICRKFITLPNVYRSAHAWHSWAAYGDMAEELTKDHSWETTNLPIERLINARDAYIVLLGVGLNSCTAVHVAEERAGRRPFIRWAVDRDGQVKRVRVAGCSKGFNNFMPYCKDLFKEIYIGNCRALATPLEPFIIHMASVIAAKPELGRCSITCLRCRDAILGGGPPD
jgi:aminoglycoside 3-N-acetyltransferase